LKEWPDKLQAYHDRLSGVDMSKSQAIVNADGDVEMPQANLTGEKRKQPPVIDPVGPDQKKMNVPTDAPMLQAGSTTSSSTGNGQETSVSPYDRVERGIFTETRTVELPWTGFLSMNNVDKDTPVALKLRLNSPYNFLIDNTLVGQTIATAATKGLSNTLHPLGTGVNSTTITVNTAFPHTIVGPSAKTATVSSYGTLNGHASIPAWLKWYEKIYESYHVIKCDWTITATSTVNSYDRKPRLFVEYDAYTGSSTGNIIPTNKNLRHYMKWPRVSTHELGVPGQGKNQDENAVRTFHGTWMPGTIQKNTKNEEDIKTWYATGSEPSPAWVEQVVLLAMLDDTAVPTQQPSINIRMDLKWTIQFKDLKSYYRYIDDDAAHAGATDLIIPDDIRQIPYVVETVP
jgi:hypothetical protein